MFKFGGKWQQTIFLKKVLEGENDKGENDKGENDKGENDKGEKWQRELLYIYGASIDIPTHYFFIYFIIGILDVYWFNLNKMWVDSW